MTKNEVIERVRKQLAIDLCCSEKDFEPGKIVVTAKKPSSGAITYEEGDRAMAACCFGGAAVFCVDENMVGHFKQLLDGREPEWIFDPQTLIRFNELLYLEGQNVGNMIQYYVPDPSRPKTEPIGEIRWIDRDEIKKYLPEMNGSDMIAVAAIRDGKIAGIAGASAKSPLMWEIAINVQPEYRNQGIAANLVALIKDRLLDMDVVPYYGTAASHTISLSVGVDAGFFPCWTRLYSRPRDDEFLHIHDR